MACIKPFGALRYTPAAGEAASLVCPPYDIISEEEREAYLRENPRNIIRLELPREGADPYAAAGSLLEQWMAEGLLACDSKAALYIYEEEFTALGEKKRVKGFVCRVRLEEFDKEVVLPHEETLSKAKEDRFNLMCATGCNFSSIYSLYFDEEQAVFPRIDSLSRGEPDLCFPAMGDVVHRVWVVTDPGAIASVTEAFAEKKLYIADGHHRYETGLRYRDHLRARGMVTDSEHPANYIMMTLVNMEHPGLVVYPTHRILRDLPAFDSAALLESCREYFQIDAAADQDALQRRLDDAYAQGKKAVGYWDGTAFICLTLREDKAAVMAGLLPGASPAYQQLDVNLLHTLILERLLGIDKENMASQKNLTYTRDPGEAVAAVESGADCAFLLNPTRVEEIAAVAGAGEKMPQKSTYFYPKLVTGHVMNRLMP